ncbi:MAG: zinc ribbon domain-containing protein [Oscillospiraceae bacterium]|nr:zinc ribbon domain-containing protein [Oscillospiraceae bacterium]
MRLCKNCGAENEDEAAVCKFCGFEFESVQGETGLNSKEHTIECSDEKPEVTEKQEKNKNGVIVFLTIIIAILLTVIILLLLFLIKNIKTDDYTTDNQMASDLVSSESITEITSDSITEKTNENTTETIATQIQTELTAEETTAEETNSAINQTENESVPEEKKEPMAEPAQKGEDYVQAYGELVSQANELNRDSVFRSYTLFDIDNNGIYELILAFGTCEADRVYKFFTIDNNIIKYCGDLSGGHSYFTNMDGKLCNNMGHMGYQHTDIVSLTNKYISTSSYYDSYEAGEDMLEDYYTFGTEIKMYDFSDSSLLAAYSQTTYEPHHYSEEYY